MRRSICVRRRVTWSNKRNVGLCGVRGSVQAGMSRNQFPMRWIFLNLPNPSSRTIVLDSTLPLTEMSKESSGGGGGVKGGRRVILYNLTAIWESTI
jgi:hypothetical protein